MVFHFIPSFWTGEELSKIWILFFLLFLHFPPDGISTSRPTDTDERCLTPTVKKTLPFCFFCRLLSPSFITWQPLSTYLHTAFRKKQYFIHCPVDWSCRIHRLHLCRGVKPRNECTRYDTKQSDGEVPVMLELWGMRSTPSLPLLQGPLWPGMVASDKGPICGLNRTNGILMLNWIVWLNWIAWNRNVFDKPYLHLNRVLMLNWIIWNGTLFWHWNCTYTKLICLELFWHLIV